MAEDRTIVARWVFGISISGLVGIITFLATGYWRQIDEARKYVDRPTVVEIIAGRIEGIRERVAASEKLLSEAQSNANIALQVSRDHGTELESLRSEILRLDGKIIELRQRNDSSDKRFVHRTEVRALVDRLLRDVDRLEEQQRELRLWIRTLDGESHPQAYKE